MTQRDGWNPIATAPKDGSLILCFIPGNWENVDRWCLAFWKGTGLHLQEDDHLYIDDATHWHAVTVPNAVRGEEQKR